MTESTSVSHLSTEGGIETELTVVRGHESSLDCSQFPQQSRKQSCVLRRREGELELQMEGDNVMETFPANQEPSTGYGV